MRETISAQTEKKTFLSQTKIVDFSENSFQKKYLETFLTQKNFYLDKCFAKKNMKH